MEQSILALIAELYATVNRLQQENAELRKVQDSE